MNWIWLFKNMFWFAQVHLDINDVENENESTKTAEVIQNMIFYANITSGSNKIATSLILTPSKFP